MSERWTAHSSGEGEDKTPKTAFEKALEGMGNSRGDAGSGDYVAEPAASDRHRSTFDDIVQHEDMESLKCVGSVLGTPTPWEEFLSGDFDATVIKEQAGRLQCMINDDCNPGVAYELWQSARAIRPNARVGEDVSHERARDVLLHYPNPGDYRDVLDQLVRDRDLWRQKNPRAWQDSKDIYLSEEWGTISNTDRYLASLNPTQSNKAQERLLHILYGERYRVWQRLHESAVVDAAPEPGPSLHKSEEILTKMGSHELLEIEGGAPILPRHVMQEHFGIDGELNCLITLGAENSTELTVAVIDLHDTQWMRSGLKTPLREKPSVDIQAEYMLMLMDETGFVGNPVGMRAGSSRFLQRGHGRDGKEISALEWMLLGSGGAVPASISPRHCQVYATKNRGIVIRNFNPAGYTTVQTGDYYSSENSTTL